MKFSEFLRFVGVYRRCGNSLITSFRMARDRVFDSNY